MNSHQERHRIWIDLVAEMFGGLDLCSLEALVARDGTEVIIEVNDCAMGLLGESQEEDRRNIAEVIFKIYYVCFSILMQNQVTSLSLGCYSY